ncbi:unnamed protein product [Cladocopium goreaui]|uniref:Developmentally-regulated G-protein 1 n=1 Tax=Cladocopium goreaui TaxID=2562237 RepID=A0A9P1DRP6_9DINO|nr:unnamed protein product [Cladocopium goreaui]
MAPKGLKWKVVLSDESRRSYVPSARLGDFFKTIYGKTAWEQPEGPQGLLPRKTVWMVKSGCQCPYRYGGVTIKPQEFPDWMTELLRTYMPYCGKSEEEWPDSCNVNLYEDGSHAVGWHTDDEALFQSLHQDVAIVSLSLGQPRKFDLRKNWPEEGERLQERLHLGNGALATMEGMLQKHYMHRIARDDESLGPRINLTWRWIKKHADVKENKDHQVLDTLDAEGSCIFTRTRGAVTEKGLWHRYVHVWVLNLPDSAVLMQLRAPEKKRFGGMWNCTSGFVMSGMPSLEACKHHLDTESGLRYEDHMYEFVFSCKNTSVANGEEIKQLIDVYVVSLKRPPELHKIYYDIKEATELKYVGIGELEQAYQNQDPNFVLVSTPEYARRLFHFLHKKIRIYIEMLPKIDSDEERHNKKGQQLLDRIGDVNKLRRAQDLGVVVEPCKRIDAYSESVWHRAVHVWVFDVESCRLLLLLRSPKKRHFGGRWNCSTGHIKMGDPALPTALKSVKDDVGLGNVTENDFEYLFQTLVEMDTGGDAFLKQVVDVYLLSVPNEETCPVIPDLTSLSLAKGEVDQVMYLELDRLQEVYTTSPPPHDFVVFPGDDYQTRFFFNLRQRHKKYLEKVAEPPEPPMF